MIISIWKKQDLDLVKELPTEVISVIETTIEILDEDYGTERTTEDLGGYVAVVDKAGIKQLKQKQLNGIIPEYIDEIEGAEYISALFLCSNDFSIVVICKKELIQSNEFNGRSCFKAKTGNMYFGGVNGFNVFNPDNVYISEFKPKIIFDNFEVNGSNKKDISNTKFKYNENNIKISFFTNDYMNTKTTQYYYKLDGEEKKWNTTKNNSIVFANLNSGEYTLRIKAKSQHGVMGEESVVKFTIKSPFWKSNYAMCLYLLFIIIGILINRYKVKKLDRLVNEKTNDLRVQMDKNEVLFKKVLTLEQNKNNYFINLSHELRTPLNVLNGINQLIKDLCKK